MHVDSWLNRFWQKLKSSVIKDVPASLEECESCRETNCTQTQWEFCARRLAAETESLLESDSLAPTTTTGRTEEMPRISASQDIVKLDQQEEELIEKMKSLKSASN
jgi:hypothetical protein